MEVNLALVVGRARPERSIPIGPAPLLHDLQAPSLVHPTLNEQRERCTDQEHRHVDDQDLDVIASGELPIMKATPVYAAAGMVVTEIATPTAALARTSAAIMPAIPSVLLVVS